MELRHLKYFTAVAEELHFGRAAKRLHIAQPPLSQQIKKLEEELGVKLFERTRRKVELTPVGRLFLEEARLTLTQAERAKRIAIEAEHGVRGSLRVGFVTSSSYSILPIVIRRFRQQNPLIDLELKEMIPSSQIKALENAEIDAGILRPPVDNSYLVLDTVLQEPLVAALPTGHPKAAQKSIALKTLAEDAFVMFPRHHGPGMNDAIMHACREAGFMPNIVYEPNEMQTILAYVAGGLGIGLVPQSLSSFHQGAIAYRPLSGRSIRLELSLIKRANDSNAALLKFHKLCSIVGEEYVSQFRKNPSL